MPIKLLLDSNKVYHKIFEGSKPGYDSFQVDAFLDLVIKDYETFASYVSETDSKVEKLEGKIKVLNEQLSKVEAQNAAYQAKLGDVTNNPDASLSNLELLKRISALEKALSKTGINPNTIE